MDQQQVIGFGSDAGHTTRFIFQELIECRRREPLLHIDAAASYNMSDSVFAVGAHRYLVPASLVDCFFLSVSVVMVKV